MREVIDVDGQGERGGGYRRARRARRFTSSTMTVTEKGYCLDSATGALDLDNPDLRADFEGGFAAPHAARAARPGAGAARGSIAPPLTLISCDNFRPTASWLGRRCSELSRRSAPRRSPNGSRSASPFRARWSIGSCRRRRPKISIASPPARRARRGRRRRRTVPAMGDRGPFAGERPPWDLAGAKFVADAKPYEKIKMRVLNAAQSTLSHLGAIVGHEFSFRRRRPVLPRLTRRCSRGRPRRCPRSQDGGRGLCRSSLARIANTAIRHRCHQIGTDGSQKIVQRLLDPLRAARGGQLRPC